MTGMSLIPVAQGQVPDFLKELGGYQDEGMASGIGVRAPKLGITIDKKWSITEEGQTRILETAVDHNGQRLIVATPSVNLVIVAASGTLTKAWYEKAYTPGQFDAPDCFSNDGKVPAPGVAKPQCSNCAACPKNAFGSHPTTGRGKACNDRKMIVVCWDGAPDKLMTFNVPTMSLNALRKIDTDLRNANVPMQSVMMRLEFDQNVTYPVVKISAVGFVDKETCLRLREASESEEVASMLREVDYDVPAALNAVVPQNNIQFGAGQSNGAANNVANTGSGETAAAVGQNTDSAGAAQAPKRVRRTRAQIEADRAAAAGLAPQQQTIVKEPEPQATAAVQPEAVQGELDPQAALIAQLQAALAAAQKPVEPEPPKLTPQEQMIADLQAQLAAAQAAPAPDVTQVINRADVAQAIKQADATPTVTEQVQQADAGGGVTETAPAGVLAMLNKWKS